MEGETIKKKYSSILDMLKKERLTFSNQLEVTRSQTDQAVLACLICFIARRQGWAGSNKIYPFKALETTIKKQDDEIERLKNTQKVINL